MSVVGLYIYIIFFIVYLFWDRVSWSV